MTTIFLIICKNWKNEYYMLMNECYMLLIDEWMLYVINGWMNECCMLLMDEWMINVIWLGMGNWEWCEEGGGAKWAFTITWLALLSREY